MLLVIQEKCPISTRYVLLTANAHKRLFLSGFLSKQSLFHNLSQHFVYQFGSNNYEYHHDSLMLEYSQVLTPMLYSNQKALRYNFSFAYKYRLYCCMLEDISD